MPDLLINDYEEEDYNDYQTAIWELEDSNVMCPQGCEDTMGSPTMMKVYPEGTSPDDYDNILMCPNCLFTERD